MTPIKKVITKNGKIQYHEYKLRQLRSFRISAADAEIKLATGESYLVDKFWYEQTEEEIPVKVEEVKHIEPINTPSNVVSFSDKLKENKDKKDMEKAKTHFINNILPEMTYEEKQKVLFNPEQLQEILLDAMLRISVKNYIQ